jgi:hypothetical protein
LQRLVEGVLDQPELPDVAQWRMLVEMTANHAGLVVAGDVALVGDILRSEPAERSLLASDIKLRDLVLWVLSNRHGQVRSKLQLRIDSVDPEAAV